MLNRYIILTTLLLLSFVSLFSQRTYYVRGYVMDENKNAIELANIYIKGTTTGATSNERGYYEVAVNKADSITIVFSCIGYESIERTFGTTETAANINAILRSSSTELEGVEVRAFKRQTSTMATLETKDFKLMPDASGGNIESLLVSFAGVSSNNEMSSQYSVRGGNYDENSVYVNNIEVYRPLLIRSGQQEGLSFINPDMVESVTFSAGGFDAKYGDKMSSVLDIQYKKPQKTEGAASISLLGASAYFGMNNGKFTQMHGARYKTSSYLLGTLDTKGEYQPTYVDYQTYLTYQFKPRWEVTFLGNVSFNNYKFIPQERETAFGTLQNSRSFKVFFDGQENDQFLTGFGALSFNNQRNKHTKLSFIASAFTTSEQENYDITGQYWLSNLETDKDKQDDATVYGVGTYHEHARNRLSATVVTLSHQGEYKKGGHDFQWGLALQEEIILDKMSEWEFRDSAGYSLPTDPTKVKLIYNLQGESKMISTRFTAFMQENYKLRADHGLWSFTGGLRANYWSFNQEFLLSPRFCVSFFPKWKTDINFRFATGLYYQSPFYKEVRQSTVDADGNGTYTLNRDIKAQRSLHFVLGADYFFRAFNRPFKATLEAYYKPMDRVIPYYVDNVRIRYSGKNNAVAYSAGFDVKLFGEFVPGTDSWISFSYMNSKEDILDDKYSVYSNTGNYLGDVEPGYISRPNEQRYNVTLFFQDYIPNHPQYKLFLKLVFSDGLPLGPPRSERYEAVYRTSAYNRVDIGASRGFIKGREKFMSKPFWNMFKSIWLNAEIFNLFDIRNVNSYYWVNDIYDQQYAIPNYLTGILFNFRVSVEF